MGTRAVPKPQGNSCGLIGITSPLTHTTTQLSRCSSLATELLHKDRGGQSSGKATRHLALKEVPDQKEIPLRCPCSTHPAEQPSRDPAQNTLSNSVWLVAAGFLPWFAGC